METTLVCPKCSSVMEEGFIVDRSEGFFVPNWQPGQPEVVRLLGMNMGVIVAKEKLWRPVVTYRCAQCGYLESYAP